METSTKIIRFSAFLSLIIIALFIFFSLKNDNKNLNNSINTREFSNKDNIKKIPEEKKNKVKKSDLEKMEQIQAEVIQIKLNDSDYAIRIALDKCSLHPEVNKILKTDRIIRRFVASIENISNGESPEKNLDFITFNAGFITSFKKNHIIISSESYDRYNYISGVFLSFDEDKLIELYKMYRPLLIEAYKDLGYPDIKFHDTFINAINILLKTPEINGDIYLKHNVVSYSFLNKKLEQLNNAQKQFLRMGPDNIKKIKIKLELIKYLLKNFKLIL